MNLVPCTRNSEGPLDGGGSGSIRGAATTASGARIGGSLCFVFSRSKMRDFKTSSWSFNSEILSWVPEELRVAYHILKNAHVMPPEVELLKEIHTLEDLLRYIEDDGERKATLKSLQWKMIRLDLLKRRSLPLQTVRYYGKKLVRKFYGKQGG